MAVDLTAAVILIVLLVVFGAITFFVVRRKVRAKPITIRDLRNPRKADETYYAIMDKKAGIIRFYSNLVTPLRSGILPPLDMRAYTFSGRLYGYRGVSGDPEDDNVALLRWPLVGQVDAAQQSSSIADAVQKTMLFFGACNNYKINDQVSFTYNASTYKGVITNMGYDGLEITAPTTYSKKVETKDAQGKVTGIEEKEITENMRYIFATKPDIDAAEITVTKAAEKESAISAQLSKFFTPQWSMVNYGVVPIDDVNQLRASQKDFIAEFNSKVDDRANSRKSWLERNILLVWVISLSLVLVVAYSIVIYTTSSAINTILGNVQNSAINILQLLNRTATLGKP